MNEKQEQSDKVTACFTVSYADQINGNSYVIAKFDCERKSTLLGSRLESLTEKGRNSERMAIIRNVEGQGRWAFYLLVSNQTEYERKQIDEVIDNYINKHS